MIKEAYVSFEVAKLLKEKGFREITNRYYNAQYKEIRTVSDTFMMDWNDDKHTASIMMPNAIAIPTQQMAMKWLREIHNIAIVVTPSMFWGKYNVSIYKKGNDYPFGFDGDSFISSYEEACEVTIKYCLENFI